MSQDPYAPPNAPLELEVLNESDFVKAFLAFAVCAIIAGMLGGAVIGGIIGAVWGLSGSPGPAFHTTVMILSAVTGLIINYFVFRFFVMRFIVSKVTGARQSAA